METKVLVLGNPLDHEGGMVEFNKGLITTINKSETDFYLKPFSIGSRMYLFYYPVLKKVLYPIYFLIDLLRLIVKLFKRNIRVIQVNPSLIPVPLFRDGAVLLINKLLFNKKSIIVLHGWKEYFYKKISKNKFYKYLIKKYFNSADVVFVLSSEFKDKLVNIGVLESKIKITTTFFYKENIISDSNLNHNQKKVKLLFLGRVSKLKGIKELLETLSIIAKKNSNFICNIVGHGDKPNTIDYYKKIVEKYKISNKVTFVGRKTDKEKFEFFNNSDIFIFPSHMEGCPTSVIEALASGLFVISTDVGALNDIINPLNGIKTKPKNVRELVNALEKSFNNITKIRDSRKDIAREAFEKYEVSLIADNFLLSYASLI